mmetsp:Transcript_6788/g.20602  ORF Transcript_6788/g.20602 Transcript_6788/m.20602 type:complete len:399 (-) Transcript_6788:318-1514(-)
MDSLDRDGSGRTMSTIVTTLAGKPVVTELGLHPHDAASLGGIVAGFWAGLSQFRGAADGGVFILSGGGRNVLVEERGKLLLASAGPASRTRLAAVNAMAHAAIESSVSSHLAVALESKPSFDPSAAVDGARVRQVLVMRAQRLEAAAGVTLWHPRRQLSARSLCYGLMKGGPQVLSHVVVFDECCELVSCVSPSERSLDQFDLAVLAALAKLRPQGVEKVYLHSYGAASCFYARVHRESDLVVVLLTPRRMYTDQLDSRLHGVRQRLAATPRTHHWPLEVEELRYLAVYDGASARMLAAVPAKGQEVINMLCAAMHRDPPLRAVCVPSEGTAVYARLPGGGGGSLLAAFDASLPLHKALSIANGSLKRWAASVLAELQRSDDAGQLPPAGLRRFLFSL